MSEPHGHGAGRPDEPPGFFDKPDNVRRLLMAFYVLCGVLVVLDLVIERHHVHPWENLLSFYPLYGFVGIVVLVIVAKGLRKVVMRPEDYYDAD